MNQGKFKPYPKYKPSDVEWIGEVPDGWDCLKLSRIASNIKDGTHGSFDRVQDGHPLLSAKNVGPEDLIISETESQISEADYKGIISNGFPQKDDLLVTIVGTLGRPHVYKEGKPYAFQRSVAFIRLKKVALPKYCCYQVLSQAISDQFRNNAKASAQSGLYLSDLKRLDAILPPLPEQKAIADFLDRETERINGIVKKQTRMIELLKEKRSALITCAVTKGLDPNAKMKPSGVEWIGEIPEGWEVRRLKRCLLSGKAGMRIGPFGSSLRLDIMVDEGINVYGQENVIASDYSLGKRKISLDKYEEMKAYEVFPDDILISMMGSTGSFSRVPIDVEKGIIDSHLLRMRFMNIVDLSYFVYLANYSKSIAAQIESIGKGSIMQGLNSNLVRQLILPLPPLSLQHAIAEHLDHETAKIDTLIGKIERQIELLNEHKQSLITHAVTGKIDVRGEVA